MYYLIMTEGNEPPTVEFYNTFEETIAVVQKVFDCSLIDTEEWPEPNCWGHTWKYELDEGYGYFIGKVKQHE